MTQRTMRHALRAAVLAAVLLVCTACTAPPSPEAVSRVLVVTDRFSADDTGSAWPEVIARETGADVEVDLVADSGYLTASPGAVADRIREHSRPPAVLVLALGGNDLNADVPDTVRRGMVRDALAAASATGARVIVTDPIAPAAAGGEAARQWQSIVAAAAEAAGVRYAPLGIPSGGAWSAASGALSRAGHTGVAAALLTSGALGD